MPPVTTTITATDLSALHLFSQADLFVQAIMLLLLGLSVLTWTIWIAKSMHFSSLKRKAGNFEEAFLEGEDLESLYSHTDPEDTDHPMAKVFVVGLQEWKNSQAAGYDEDNALRAGTIERVRRRMDATLTRELEQCEKGLAFLATVGSTAPFVGLLGTVWGIMNSFQSIGAMKTASLAIVAPGIAEALLATAMGLVAAIPAVIAYNRLSTRMGAYAGQLEAFAMDFLSLLEKKERKEARLKNVKAA